MNRLSTDDLTDLLHRSRALNQTLGITGMLVHLEGRFLQVLEGEEAEVKRLFCEKIRPDKRHHGIEVVTEGEIAARMFGQWSMAFHDMDSAIEKDEVGFSQFLKRGFTNELNSKQRSLPKIIFDRFRRRKSLFE